MKSFNQFLSESVNISGDFNGTLIIGNDSVVASMDWEEISR